MRLCLSSKVPCPPLQVTLVAEPPNEPNNFTEFPGHTPIAVPAFTVGTSLTVTFTEATEAQPNVKCLNEMHSNSVIHFTVHNQFGRAN